MSISNCLAAYLVLGILWGGFAVSFSKVENAVPSFLVSMLIWPYSMALVAKAYFFPAAPEPVVVPKPAATPKPKKTTPRKPRAKKTP